MNAPISAYQRPRIYDIPRENGGPVAAIPAPLPDHAAERTHRKQQLAAGLRLLAHHGVEPGLAGHLSARDPEHTDSFWVNPVGVPFAHIRASDLLLIAPEGRIVEGDGPVNLSGIPYHHAVQRARPDVVGIVHAHSRHASTWTAFGEPIPPIIADLAAFHGDQVVFVPDRNAGRDAVAAQFTAELGTRNVLLWRNHGHWTTGTTVEAAVWRFIAYERAAQIYLTARAAGTPQVELPTYQQTPEQREAWAWLSFLPYWDLIVAREPDLLL